MKYGLYFVEIEFLLHLIIGGRTVTTCNKYLHFTGKKGADANSAPFPLIKQQALAWNFHFEKAVATFTFITTNMSFPGEDIWENQTIGGRT